MKTDNFQSVTFVSDYKPSASNANLFKENEMVLAFAQAQFPIFNIAYM